MSEFIEFLQDNILVFDLIALLILFYSVTQCASKGFMMSILTGS